MRYSDWDTGYQWAAAGYADKFPAIMVPSPAAAAEGEGGEGACSWDEWADEWAGAGPSFPQPPVHSRGAEAGEKPKL